ncbi:MAG: CRTAC1 family protein [Bacteroidota bacterium]
MKYFFLIFFLGLFQQHYAYSQEISDFQPVIGQIGQLENNKDPKCHATASRLEDFMYGTPLSFEARDKRITFQKEYVKTLWLDYTKTVNNRSGELDQLAIFKEIEQKYFSYYEDELGIHLSFPEDHQVFVAARDYRQYSTVAYALRAILSVQQSFIFESETLAPLNEEVMTYFKKSIDLSVLALLKESDELARKDNDFQIGKTHIDGAVKILFNNLKSRPSTSTSKKQENLDYRALVYKIIDQKLAAYRNYNKINQSVFLRNIQVYFSRILWPKDPKVSKELTNFYTNLMVQFSADLLNNAELRAIQQNQPTVEYEEVYHAVQAYLPHSINMFEDVTYFPNLDLQNQIVIEAYDLDAFRDSGLHWQYLKYVLDDRESNLKVALDPFALEMLVEGIAQFAVLVFRMGGINAKEQGQEVMEIQHIENALLNFQSKLEEHQTMPASGSDTKIISGKSATSLITETPFSEISKEAALTFEHRNSDWLNRTIRAYVVKEDENLARLAIPPAFGGGGVAAEDMNNDGWVDVLLLGGRGNRLFKNDNGKQFVDVTDQAGLDWKRPDGNYGEPRQPILVDFDNDGWQDIFISYANDAHRIYRNRGDGTFEDMTDQANLGGKGLIGGPATSIDYDKDGLADIYIGYFGNYLQGELPTLKRHNTNGSPNRLFRNLGNFRFEDVSEGSGLQNLGWTQAVGHSDINGDGWQDLIVGNDFGINAYYLNNQDGTFTDVSAAMATDKPSYTMNIGISDLNRDLRPDFYISNIVVMEKDDKYVLPNEDTQAHFDPSSLATMRVVEANDLFISSTDKNGQPNYAKSTAIGRGYSATGWSWDADFFDFDNDGDDDLYCLTGMNQYSVYGNSNEYYSSPEGEAKEVTYANSNNEANILFSNEQGTLEIVTNSGGLDYSGTSRSAAFFDMDNDGDLEVVVNDYQNKAKLFRNNTKQEATTNNWVAIKLIGDPSQKITKDAIGTALILTTPDGEKKWKEVYSTTGYLSVHPKICHFGLGAAKKCSLEIRWPNGHVQIVENVEPNKQHVIAYK